MAMVERTKIRHRTRVPVVVNPDRAFLDEVDRLLEESDDRVPTEIPRELSERLRYFRARAGQGANIVAGDLREFLYTTIIRMRRMGVAVAEISRQLGVNERTTYFHCKKAREWCREQLSERLDPVQFLVDELEAIRMLEERVLNKAMATTVTTSDLHKMVMSATTLHDKKVSLLKEVGWFDAVNYARLGGVDKDSPEARADAVRKIMDDAFEDAGLFEDDPDEGVMVQPVAPGGELTKINGGDRVENPMDEWPEED